MTERAYSKGSQCPPLEPGKLRLYSMRFCPYAERTRLVLSHLGISHETVNVNLRNKPDWLLEKNPLGLVPVLEIDNKIIYESPICNEYLDYVYGNDQLLSKDPYNKACQKMLLERFSKVACSFFMTLRAKGEECKDHVAKLEEALKPFEEALSGRYFGVDDPNFLDFCIWPWFERLPIIKKFSGVDIIGSGKFPKLAKWIPTMEGLPAVKACSLPLELIMDFVKENLDPNVAQPNYDVGLQ